MEKQDWNVANLDFFHFLSKKVPKSFGDSKKCITFALAIQQYANRNNKLGYGVMVTLQILVLSFLVRIRVSQQRRLPSGNLFLIHKFTFHNCRSRCVRMCALCSPPFAGFGLLSCGGGQATASAHRWLVSVSLPCPFAV